MSVLLTAARSKNRKRPKRNKPSSARRAGKQKGKGAAVPPHSYMPSATTRVWNLTINETPMSLALCKDSMDVWCNDELVETTDNFADEGAQLDFCIFDHKARITITSSGNANEGMTHTLTLDGNEVPEFHG
ncbi:fas apoptotic inhibitory molecule 1-like [Tubulanus polymorphus]|uniref:fas apoptotic inhibitory molecule 1-like n=1 Tax=Tubulanus polymorphus TaxID=672921 RepID=UPI003DA66D74